MKIAFLTLGCKVNSYETDKMKFQFEAAGHRIVSFAEQADVYIVNTCTVTNIADRKSRQMLHRARRLNPEGIVVAAGCYVDSAAQRGEKDDSVDLFLSNQEKEHIVAAVQEIFHERKKEKLEEVRKMADWQEPADGEGQNVQGNRSVAATSQEHTRAYIKIQNGCNQFCTYCIIPYVRGELFSREDDEIISEVQELVEQGFVEVVITGIHLSSFGVDRSRERPSADHFLEQKGQPLLTLLRRISQIPEIARIRLGSLEPRIITEEFVRELASIPEICPHFHLSLQSGCDTVLKRMNRHYTTEEYLDKLAILREYFDKPAITTDIIVGFPQESREEFEATCDFAGKAGFAQIHVFKYSRRKNTVADGMEGQLPEAVKGERSDKLLELEEEMEKGYQSQFIGKEQHVLLEEISELQGKKYLTGYTERYVRLAVPVEEFSQPEDYCNQIISVRVLGYFQKGIMLAQRL